MRRFSSRLVSSSFLAIAASILVVGVVWASSGALQTSNNSSTVSSSTVPESNDDDEIGDGDLPGIDPGDDIDELRRLVVDLTTQVETLTETISTLQSDISDAVAEAREAATAAGKVKSIADDAAADAEEAQRVVNEVSSRFGLVELRTSKLNEEGVYSGAINPSQLSRKLSPTDMTGNWPLDRVTGEMETKHLLLPFSGNCSPRFGFYSVLVSDAFRRLGCERIAAP
jgi:chorismate mutase